MTLDALHKSETIFIRILRKLSVPILEWVREKSWRFLHDTTDFRGIDIHIHFKAPETAARTIKQALELIFKYDPVSFARISRLLPGGIIADFTDYGAAWFSVKRQACVIGGATLRAGYSSEVALCVVHEVCHARLMHHGFKYESPSLRVRHEQICIRREIAFARKLEAQLKTSGRLSEMLEEKLSNLEQQNYTEESFVRRMRRSHLQKMRMMKRINTPRWLRRLIILRTRKRWRRQNELAVHQ